MRNGGNQILWKEHAMHGCMQASCNATWCLVKVLHITCSPEVFKSRINHSSCHLQQWHPLLWVFGHCHALFTKRRKNLANCHLIRLPIINSELIKNIVDSIIKQHLPVNYISSLVTSLFQTWTKGLDPRREEKVTTLDIETAFNQVQHQGTLVKPGHP